LLKQITENINWSSPTQEDEINVLNFISLYNKSLGIGGVKEYTQEDPTNDILDSYCKIYTFDSLEPLQLLLCGTHIPYQTYFTKEKNQIYNEIYGSSYECNPLYRILVKNGATKRFQITKTMNSENLATYVSTEKVCKYNNCLFSDETINLAETLLKRKVKSVFDLCIKSKETEIQDEAIGNSVYVCQLAENASCNIDFNNLSSNNIDKIENMPDFLPFCNGCCFQVNSVDNPSGFLCSEISSLEKFTTGKSTNKNTQKTCLVFVIIFLFVIICFLVLLLIINL